MVGFPFGFPSKLLKKKLRKKKKKRRRSRTHPFNKTFGGHMKNFTGAFWPRCASRFLSPSVSRCATFARTTSDLMRSSVCAELRPQTARRPGLSLAGGQKIRIWWLGPPVFKVRIRDPFLLHLFFSVVYFSREPSQPKKGKGRLGDLGGFPCCLCFIGEGPGHY